MNALNWGTPQTNTNTVRIIHGIHATITARRSCCRITAIARVSGELRRTTVRFPAS